MDTLLHILEAIGVGAAAGLSAFVAVAAVVLLAAVHVGIDPSGSDVDFAASAAAVVVAVIVLGQAFALAISPGGQKLRIAADRPRFGPLHLVLAVILGGLGGAIVWSAEGEPPIAGALIAAASAAVVAPAIASLLSRVHDRLGAREKRSTTDDAAVDGPGATRVLAFGTDLLAIVAVAAALIVPPTALALPLLAILLLTGARRRSERKHEGLRVLR